MNDYRVQLFDMLRNSTSIVVSADDFDGARLAALAVHPELRVVEIRLESK